MNREFTIATGWKIFYSLLVAAIIVFAGFLFSLPRAEGANSAILLLPAIVLAGGLLMLVKTFRSKLIVTDNSITSTGIFKTSEIAVSDVKGIRIPNNAIVIESNIPGGKMIINAFDEYGDIEQFTDWLRTAFHDLDADDPQTEMDAILSDTSLGYTEEERKRAFDRSKIVAVAYSIGGAVIALSDILFANTTCTILAIIYPLLGIAVISKSNGLVKLISKKASPYYHILFGIAFPVVLVLVKCTTDGHVLDATNLCMPAAALAFIIVGGYSLVGTGNRRSKVRGQIYLLLLFGLMYGIGTSLQCNMIFDTSLETEFHAQVVNHHVSHGKSTSYYITIGPWGPSTENEELDVTSSQYYSSKVGSAVSIHLMKGYLNIPWYTIGN